MAKQKEQKQKQQQSDDEEDHDYSGKCVMFLNLFSMLAGIAMVVVGGMLLLRAIKGEVRMNADKWISTTYSVLMGILVIASSGAQPFRRPARRGLRAAATIFLTDRATAS